MVLLLAGVAVAFIVRPWQHDDTGGATANPPVAATLTFDSMREFVTAYYADLPTHPHDAWAKISPNGQNETGEQDFIDFWTKIQSVALISVSPRDDTSVVARLKYVRNDGGSPMEDRWLKMELLNGTVLLDSSGRIGSVNEPPTPSPGVFPAEAIDNLLLTPDEVNSILSTYGKSGDQRIGVMKVDRSTYGMADNSNLVKPPSCVGVVFGAEHGVYADTGFDAMRDQTFIPEPYVYDTTGTPPEPLEQTVIVFPSADQAQAIVASAQDRWRSCASGEVDQSVPPEDGYGWKLGHVQRQGDLLTVSMASNGYQGAAACQHVLGVRENVVVGTRSCNEVVQAPAYDPVHGWATDPGWANENASRLANAMLNKVKS
jgi:serine/threonine-protein kinase